MDFAATAVVSAAAAASYLAGEVSLPFPVYVGAVLILVFFTLVSLSGLRESARIAACILAMHVSSTVSPIFLLLIIRSKVVVMAMLIVASTIALGRGGTAQLSANWSNGHTGLTTTAIARQLFNGVCIGMLGLTGFECESFYRQSTNFSV